MSAKRVNWHREPDGRVRIVERGVGGKRWPRAACRTFDSKADDQIEAWAQNYNATIQSRIQPTDSTIPEVIYNLIQEFETYQGTKSLAIGTIKSDTRNIFKATEYFCSKTDNLALWLQHSVQLASHLQNVKKLKAGHTYQIQLSTNKFWNWLKRNKKLVDGVLDLDSVTGHAAGKDTPLQFHVKPEDVLKFVRSSTNESIKLLALCGYFGSLRPQETFALKLNDFIVGNKARPLEACSIMATLGLFDGLAIDIDKQRRATKREESTPKKNSKGLVAFFDKTGAELLVAVLKLVKADNRMGLFAYNNQYYYDLWKQSGLPGITLKDLRRASVYWLGHHTQIKIEQLKEHARHKDIQTTSLYFRRVYNKPEVDNLNFDLDA